MAGRWQVRWSPTLGELEDTHQKVWGTDNYTDDIRPTVFFGCYGLPDFYTIWRHKGEKHILWAGTDITHFDKGYWLEDGGGIRLMSSPLATWINKHCVNWVENSVEAKVLREWGIQAHVVPSFLGDVKKFEVSFKPGNKLYTSVSGDNFKLYGWHLLIDLALNNPNIEIHCYGNKTDYFGAMPNNLIVHGRVPKEQMNAEISEMQGALRLTEFDGFSEIIAKSILMGQYPVSLIEYPHMLKLDQISEILTKTTPNYEGRNYYIKQLNNYPWNSNI